jgi:putative Holliday junction resolvase
MTEIPDGKVLAVDVGDVRVGLAVSDPSGFLASPLSILKRSPAIYDEIVAIAGREGVCAILIGLPLNMDGSVGFQAKKVQRFGAQLADKVAPVPVLYEDERESTEAARELRLQRGTKQKGRRARIDSEAAAIFLQAWLDRRPRRQLGAG